MVDETPLRNEFLEDDPEEATLPLVEPTAPPTADAPLPSVEPAVATPPLRTSLQAEVNRSVLTEDDSPSKKNRKILLGAAAALVVLVGGVGAYGALSNSSDTVETLPPLPQTDGQSTANQDGGPAKPWYVTNPDATVPLELPPWALEASDLNPDNLTDEQLAYFDKQLANTPFLGAVKGTLLSEASGITSDPAKATDSNGYPNMNYSYVTSEQFLKDTGLITEALLNPYFGGWGDYQFSSSAARDNFDPNRLSPLFSQRYRSENFGKSDQSYFPVFADWNGNDYGMAKTLVPTAGARWVGRITDAQGSLTYDKNRLAYGAHVVYHVTFTAKTRTQGTVQKKGTLTVDYVTDLEATQNPGGLRIVVDDAKLSVS